MKTRFFQWIIALLIISFLLYGLVSCPETVPETKTVVYIAGNCADGIYKKACYWKDGVKTNLLSIGDHSAYNTSIVVKEGDVYSGGYYLTESGGSSSTACYWKNGIRYDFETNKGVSKSIFVDTNDDVYIAGNYWNADNSRLIASYWKNGVIDELSTVYSSGYSIVIDGTDIYVSGYFMDVTSVPCYWINGTQYDLPYNDISAYANELQVEGNDIYIAGDDYFSDIGYLPCYWKNGVQTLLSIPGTATTGYAFGLYVDGNDLYIAGYYNIDEVRHACFWKNGERTDLLPAGSRATSIMVVGGDVYTVGYYTSGQDDIACYWLDKDRTDLAEINSQSTDIFIVEEQVE